jgi:carbamoyltransferase
LGSATFLINRLNNKTKNFNDNPYLGPSFSNLEIEKILRLNTEKIKEEKITIIKYKTFEELSLNLSKELSKGKIAGFFNGRMEWGPRALGARSILADPRNENIRQILNLKIKRRESFRPFAPSIIDKYVKDWFENEEEVPFMSKVFQVKKNKRKIIPAVTHVDGSGRLQTVSKKYNFNFYSLINNFYKLTKVPILLNTSFNENEPIVCNPTEAIECFLRTKMDILVLENFYLYR